MKQFKVFGKLFVAVLLLSSFLAGCGAPATEAAPGEAPAATEAAAPVATEPLAPQPTVDPRLGGTTALSLAAEPDTLDVHKTTEGVTDAVMSLVGADLITKDPATGEFVPYLAESWTVSDDGLTFTFTLKDNIKFHDGSSLTAQDYAYTFQRAMAPETASPLMPVLLAGMTNVEATDDRTLVFTIAEPNYYFLDSLALGGYVIPYSQAYVEANGDDYIARNPMSVGPYIFKEWVTGEKIVLERNPDFNWGPVFHPGPYNIQTIEFKIILDQATDLAALETGEILMSGVPDSEISRFQDPSQFTIYETVGQTLYPALAFNLNRAPWDDINVRKAINFAVNRQGMIDVLLGGKGKAINSPLGAGIQGYNPVTESTYTYDPEQAKALLADAGYTLNASGMMEKDGQPLAFTVLSPPYDFVTPVLELLQQQLLEVGIQMEIETVDPSILSERQITGDFDVTVSGYNYPNADVLYLFFHSSMLGTGLNVSVSDPTLDEMLVNSRLVIDSAEHARIVNEIQTYIVDQSYWVCFALEVGNVVVSTNLQDAVWSDALQQLNLSNAWLLVK